jgi:hypothetical protein
MGTFIYGYHYDRGVRIGYNISFGSIILFEVSAKDKSRIIREAKEAGHKRAEISVERVEV